MLEVVEEDETGRRSGWTATIRVKLGEQETRPVLCCVLCAIYKTPTQGCDRGDRVNDMVSDNNKYSMAERAREGTQEKCVMQGRGCGCGLLESPTRRSEERESSISENSQVQGLETRAHN